MLAALATGQRAGGLVHAAVCGGRRAQPTDWDYRGGAQTGDRVVAVRDHGVVPDGAQLTPTTISVRRARRAAVTLVRAARLTSGFLREPSYRWSGAPFGPAHACSWCVTTVTTDRRWSGEVPDFSRTGQCERRERTIARRVMTGAASAGSLLVRSPLRRELARTLAKGGGLTTDSLIEGIRIRLTVRQFILQCSSNGACAESGRVRTTDSPCDPPAPR